MPALAYRLSLPSPDDPEVYGPICSAIAIGHPHSTAAPKAGISEATLNRWIRLGNEELGELEEWKPWEEVGSHAQFVIRVKEAEAEMVDEALHNWRNAEKSWPAWATLLERRRPQDFGRRDRLEVDQRSVAVAISVTVDSLEAAQSVLQTLAQREQLKLGPGAQPTPQE